MVSHAQHSAKTTSLRPVGLMGQNPVPTSPNVASSTGMEHSKVLRQASLTTEVELSEWQPGRMEKSRSKQSPMGAP